MSDHIDASTQHGAGDSPDTTAPTKHSLRALEPASSGPSTREEDLANGPLLLALGDGLEEPTISHPEFYLASQYSDHHRPEESVIPFIPLRLPEALDIGAMTSSAMSQSGPSLSVPTESIPDTSHPPRSLTEDILGISQPLLLPTEDILSENRSLPLPASQVLNDIKSLLAELNDSLVIRDRDLFPFSRSCEFSWRDSGLLFGGEPFEVTRTPNDAFSVVNAGSSYASSQSCSSSISTPSSSDTMDSDTTAEPSEPSRLIAMYSYADWVVELLIDDLYRSCAPQASNRRTTGASKKVSEGASNNPEGQKKGFNRKARSRKRKALGGDGESEDEDPQDKKRKSSDIGKDEKRWACPFVKWDPEEYRCNISPTQIRGLGFSPYVNKATCDFMDRAEVHFRSKRSQEILEEESSKSGFKGAEGKQLVDIIWDKYFPRMFQEKAINGERVCELISHDQQVVDNDQLSQIDVAGTSKAITEREPQYQASPLSLGETSIPHQFPELKLEDSPMFDLQTPAGEIILGDDTSSDLLNLAGFEDPLDGVDSRELEGCSQEMLGGVLPYTFDNALYGNLDTDENYLGFTAGIDWSGT
ncbi:hypothetical protein FAUST_6288 [Fusarium austroamericanum]|uniref:Uncharacterized protein n=1 Tax=Fusarium austroamericanum TaxID=282268 RepID=A0AAN5Z8K8_FUSAU|nr:hypothetical protein FAUST_6288 [Fusarium austroamericanum]